MATCQQIINYALIQTGIIESGGTPTSAESADGLVALQSLYDQWVHNGMFGELEDVYMDADDTAEEGKRYFVPTGYTLTAATSSYVDSGGDIRQPRDLALYESLTEAGTRTVKLYDRTAWVSMTGLGLSDTAPLSARNAFGLAACLASSGGFAGAFGVQANEGTIALARHFLRSLMSKQGSTQDKKSASYY